MGHVSEPTCYFSFYQFMYMLEFAAHLTSNTSLFSFILWDDAPSQEHHSRFGANSCFWNKVDISNLLLLPNLWCVWSNNFKLFGIFIQLLTSTSKTKRVMRWLYKGTAISVFPIKLSLLKNCVQKLQCCITTHLKKICICNTIVKILFSKNSFLNRLEIKIDR